MENLSVCVFVESFSKIDIVFYNMNFIIITDANIFYSRSH